MTPEKYPQFCESFARIGRVLAPLMTGTPPSIDRPTAGDLWNLGKIGKRFSRPRQKGCLPACCVGGRWRSQTSWPNGSRRSCCAQSIAARGIYGAFAGPWSAGTSAQLLTQAAFSGHPSRPPRSSRRNGRADAGAGLRRRLEAGAKIRTGASVVARSSQRRRATGVVA